MMVVKMVGSMVEMRVGNLDNLKVEQRVDCSVRLTVVQMAA